MKIDTSTYIAASSLVRATFFKKKENKGIENTPRTCIEAWFLYGFNAVLEYLRVHNKKVSIKSIFGVFAHTTINTFSA